MRTIIFSLLIVALFSGMRCSEDHPAGWHVTAHSIIIDVSDKAPVPPEVVQGMRDGSPVQEDSLAGHILRVSVVGNLAYTQTWEASIRAVDMMTFTPHHRERDLQRYWHDHQVVVDSVEGLTMERQETYLYPLLREELMRMVQVPAEQKHVDVVSDLLEYRSEINMYDSRVDEDSIRHFFAGYGALPDLTGIAVAFYLPRSTNEVHQRTAVVYAVYKKMLEERGAAVSSNLVFHVQTDMP